MLSAVPLLSTAMPMHAARFRLLAMERGHAVLEQDLDAGLRAPRLPAAASGRCPRTIVVRCVGSAGSPVCISGQSIDRGSAFSRGTELPTEAPPCRSGALSTKTTPCATQPFEGRRAVVGEGADDLAVVVAVIGKAVRLDHRPIGQVAEQQVGRVLDAVFLLHAGAAAERDVAAAAGGVAAGMRLRLDEDDRSASFARTIAAGKPDAPEPTTTTSAVWSHFVGCPCASAATGTRPPAATAAATPLPRNRSRLLIVIGPSSAGVFL